MKRVLLDQGRAPQPLCSERAGRRFTSAKQAWIGRTIPKFWGLRVNAG